MPACRRIRRSFYGYPYSREETLNYLRIIAAGSILFAAGFGSAQAQQNDPAVNYPNRAVKIIASSPAGGGVDIIARLIGERLQKRFGQPFVVENRAGAGGGAGAEPVYLSDPDGYTLLVSQPSVLTTNTAMYRKLNYDPAGFEPISMLADVPNVLLVRPNFPAKSAKEFVDYVKANPGKLNYGSQGVGSRAHLTAELFDARAGTKLVHVPYKGSAPALNDLIAGHIDLIFMELPSAMRLHEAGKANILAVTANKRLAMLPDVPTMEEAGVPIQSTTWTAMSAPPKTPKAIIMKLNGAINAELRTEEVKAQYGKLVTDPTESNPETLRGFIQDETKLWVEVIRLAKIQPE